ncbi:unnamed protein product [Sphenostylis stenocarpa]|uniref:Uncharacterized protein n=1 Tax=Sphenostylis stenocarpa TaxID=92480 RepID=A0AA86S5H1_9FABA|nr:unnamed protein product [Sphenostylis stenocarpa]
MEAFIIEDIQPRRNCTNIPKAWEMNNKKNMEWGFKNRPNSCLIGASSIQLHSYGPKQKRLN